MSKVEEILGADASGLLQHQCKTIPREHLHLPGPDYVDRAYGLSDRPTRVLGSLQSLLSHGRLGGTGYVSILPVDQGVEHPPTKRVLTGRRWKVRQGRRFGHTTNVIDCLGLGPCALLVTSLRHSGRP